MAVFTVRAAIAIDAPLQHVWEILCDLPGYQAWNHFVPGMEASRLAVGERLVMRVRMRPRLRVTSVETITAVDAEAHHLAWDTRLPGWLLRGVRHQYLTVIDDGHTRYTTSEAFQGILAPLLWLLFVGDLRRGFARVAQDLKARSEA